MRQKGAIRVSDIKQQKAALRKSLRAKSRTLAPAYRSAADAAIRSAVLESPLYAKADTIFAYLGVDWEINTRPLLERILADGKRLCLPLCVAEHEMALCHIRSLDELVDGKYNIPEPPRNAPVLTADEVDLALIPCVGADKTGRRLGQGGGYYDTFLTRYRGALLLLCREAAVVEEIPVEAHDFRLPLLVTETGVHNCGDKV